MQIYISKGGKKSETNLRKFFKQLRQEIEDSGATHINLFSGGDDLEGAHKESTLVSNTKMPIQQATQYQEILAEEIAELAKVLQKINFYFLTSSNHTEVREWGSSGEFIENDLLISIASYLKAAWKNIDNINLLAKPVFIDRKLETGGYVSFTTCKPFSTKKLRKIQNICAEINFNHKGAQSPRKIRTTYYFRWYKITIGKTTYRSIWMGTRICKINRRN